MVGFPLSILKQLEYHYGVSQEYELKDKIYNKCLQGMQIV